MSEQMSEYFKQKPEYKRLLNGIKSKYINLGEIKGNVVIKNPDKNEQQALSGLMKKDYSKNKTITINLKKLPKRIDESRYSGAELKEIILKYFKEEIITKITTTHLSPIPSLRLPGSILPGKTRSAP